MRYRPNSGEVLTNLCDNNGGTRLDFYANSYNVGDELFYITTPDNVSTFTINYHRPIYRPGFEIYKNGVLVYTDASVTRSADLLSPLIVTYNV